MIYLHLKRCNFFLLLFVSGYIIVTVQNLMEKRRFSSLNYHLMGVINIWYNPVYAILFLFGETVFTVQYLMEKRRFSSLNYYL